MGIPFSDELVYITLYFIQFFSNFDLFLHFLNFLGANIDNVNIAHECFKPNSWEHSCLQQGLGSQWM